MPPPKPNRRLLRRVITGVFYFLLLCTDVALTNWDELFGPENCSEVSLTTRMWYQRVVTLGYRKPKPHFVRILTVTPPAGIEPCGYRQLLATILAKMGDLQPAMVVLDYSFSPHNCSEATKELQSAIDTLASKIPVVYGQKTYTIQELEDDSRLSGELASLKQAGFSADDLALWPTDIVPTGTGSAVIGLYRLDCDTRRVPLNWPVFMKNNETWARAPQPEPTVSFVAATLHDDTLQDLPKIYRDENPFTSFIPQDLFHPVDHVAFLRNSDSVDRWHFHQRIVVVGDAVSDMRNSVIGRVPGVVLQANYIESLLDDRYFRGLGPVMTFLTTFVFLVIVAFIFEKTVKLSSAFFRAAFFWLILALASYVALVHFAMLFTFWVPVLPAILVSSVVKAHSE